MTRAEALEEANRAGATDRFFVTIHARGHRDGRNVHRADIRVGLRTATSARPQERDRWRIDGGTDLDGDDLTLIVVFDAGLVVVTVF